MKKLITLLLAAAMLVPMMTFMASAAEIENLYNPAESKIGIPSTATIDGAFSNNANYHGSNAVSVKEGDVVTFGPVMRDQSYYLTAYGADGKVKTAQIKYTNCTDIGELKNNARILKWKVPAGVTSIRLANSQMFRDCTVITVNNEFTAEEYFAYMKKANINVDFLLNPAATGTLDNKFPSNTKIFLGRSHSSEGDVLADAYRTCDYIPVKSGDVIYFGAAVTTQGYHLTLYNANKKATTNVTSAYMVLLEDIGRGYGIYAYMIRSDSAYVRVVASTGVWEDKITLATVNQPFNGDDYRKMFNITYSHKPLRESVLNGKTALFMGDSISYGAGDKLSYTVPGRAWAGRIAATTGLISTNASVSGSKVSFMRADDKAKWHFTQFEAHKNEQFDMVVIQGGVNDARHNRIVGKPLDINTDEATLEKEKDTYAGGLQWLFHNVKKTWPEATLFFIANHRLDGHSTGQAKKMGPYFDQAKVLCEMYGFVYIDLYNNEELEAKLNSKSTKYLPDTLHINAEGYEIVTPYILEVLEATMTPPAPETEPETDPVTDPVTEAPATDAPVTDAPTTEAPESGGCGAMASTFSILAIITLAGAFIARKRK